MLENHTILDDLKTIDEKIMGIDINSLQAKSFYELISNNLNLVEKCIKTVEEYTDKKKHLNPYIQYITTQMPKINYNELKNIKNKKKYATTIICISIIWAFNETSKYKHTIKNNLLAHDSYSIINEIYDFIEMFKIWNLTRDKNILTTKISKKENNTFIYRIISVLIHGNIIKAEATYIREQNKKKICYNCGEFKKTRVIKIHTKPLKYKKITGEYILLGEHYCLSWKLLINNPNNDSTFVINEESTIEIMTKLFVNIDFEHYKAIVKMYCEENNVAIETAEIIYETYLTEYKKEIKNTNIDLAKELGKKLAIYQKAMELKEIMEMPFTGEENFFIPWNYDFRGRTYYLSDISFTFHKEFRWCMYKDWYKEESDFIPTWHFYNGRIHRTMDKNIGLLKNLNITIATEDTFIKYTIMWLLISLGEVNKTKLGKKVHISSFISEGISIFNNYEKSLKTFTYSDKLKVFTLHKAINECAQGVKNQKIRKRLISKDAPASVFQHLVLNFGWKNDDLLKKVNLMSEDEWYDIYTFFTEEWKEKIRNSKNLETGDYEKILDFFNRSSLKKVIMTSNYGVSQQSAETYFKEIIYKIEPHEIDKTKKFINENWKEIKSLFNNFFKFISELSILKENPNEIIKYIKEKKGIISLIDAIVDVNYFKKKKYTVDIQHDGKRYTKTFNAIDEEKDIKKFEIATRANFIHSLDAALTRWIIKKHRIYTIHDCFLIEMADITFLISLINEGMSEKFHNFHKTWEKEKKDIFSIFIVI